MLNDNGYQATMQDIDLWVDSAKGSDWNSGTQNAPLKTIVAAVRKIPLVVRHNITVNVKAGIYQETLDLLFLLAGRGSIQFVGTDWNNFAPATGIQAGTFDADFGVQTLPNTATCAAGGWTADALKGKFIHITSGSESGKYLPVASNTATTIDFGMPADRDNDNGRGKDLRNQTFSIVEHAVILEHQTSKEHLIRVSGTTPPAPSASPWVQNGVLFQNFQFNPGSAWDVLGCGSGGVLRLSSCKLNFSNDTVYGFFGGHGSTATFVATDCYWAMLSNNNYGFATGASAVRVNLVNCIMEDGGRVGLAWGHGCFLNISGLYQNQQLYGVEVRNAEVACSHNIVFRGQPTALYMSDRSLVRLQPKAGCGLITGTTSSGIRIVGSNSSVQLNNLIVDNCATGVQLEGAHTDVDLQNCTIRNNASWGVNMATNKHASFNSVGTNNLTIMNGNTNGDFTLDGHVANSILDLRAAPDKTISNQGRFNRLFEP